MRKMFRMRKFTTNSSKGKTVVSCEEYVMFFSGFFGTYACSGLQNLFLNML